MDKSPVLGLGKSLAEWSDAQMYEQNFRKILKFFISDKLKNFENPNDLNFSDKPKVSNSDDSHLRIGAKASATIQFRQKVAPKTPPKVANYYL